MILLRGEIRSIKIDPQIELKSTVYQENIGSLSTNKATSKIIRFGIPEGTSSGFYSMELILQACRGSTCNDYVHDALITVQSPSTLEVSSIDPTFLKAGEMATITFTLRNFGDSEISNVIFSWQDSSNNILPLGSENRKFISSIGGNAEKDVLVDVVVDPDATAGVYSLALSADYNDQTGTAKSINSTAGIRVIGDFDFITVLESQGIIAPGKTASAEIKIVNRGDQDAKFLTLKISSDAFSVDPSEIYIGNLKPDDYSTEKISLTAKNVGEGSQKLNVDLYFKDAYGSISQETQTVNILVSSLAKYDAAQPKPSYDWLFIIAFLVVAYLLYRRFRKKKR